MENEIEKNLKKAMKRFEDKELKITQSGIIDSAFKMEEFDYTIEEGILTVEENNEVYLQIDIDDIEEIQFECILGRIYILVLRLGRGIDIELKAENMYKVAQKRCV